MSEQWSVEKPVSLATTKKERVNPVLALYENHLSNPSVTQLHQCPAQQPDFLVLLHVNFGWTK